MSDETMLAPVGDGLLGRVLNARGEPIDNRGPLVNVERAQAAQAVATAREQTGLFETGIKAIDLLCPIAQGGVIGLFANAGVGKLVVTEELIYHTVHSKDGYAVCLSMGEGGYESSEMMLLLREGELEERCVVLFEQVTDSLEARQRMLRAGLRMAKHFQEMKHAVLLVMDKHVANGDGAHWHELLQTLKGHGVTTVLLGVEDDLSLPGELDGHIALTRRVFERKIYPAVDAQLTSSLLLEGEMIGAEHAEVARRVKEVLRRGEELGDMPVERLAAGDAQLVGRARRAQFFLAQPFCVAEAYTQTPGEYVSMKETVEGLKALLNGDYDDLPEQAFYFVGAMEQALAKART